MSQLDTELNLLKQRIEMLEEQKRLEAEKEIEKKSNPIKVLEDILEEKKKCVNTITQTHSLDHINSHFSVSKDYKNLHINQPECYFFNERDKIAMLEPIFNMLTDIQKRLEALEKK